MKKSHILSLILILITSSFTTPAHSGDPCRRDTERAVQGAGSDEVDMYRAGSKAYEECRRSRSGSSGTSEKTLGDYIGAIFGLVILLGIGYGVIWFIKDAFFSTGMKQPLTPTKDSPTPEDVELIIVRMKPYMTQAEKRNNSINILTRELNLTKEQILDVLRQAAKDKRLIDITD